jgi:hypothetical protein
MDLCKRPHFSTEINDKDNAPSSSSSPTNSLLQTQISTLRSQLTHTQSLRSINRKSHHNFIEKTKKRKMAQVPAGRYDNRNGNAA